MAVDRNRSSRVETNPAHAVRVALPPRVLSTFLDRVAAAASCPRALAMPVMVLTSEEGPGVEATVLQLGANDYVVKPFDPDALSSRVKAAFRRLRVAAA
jgi:CheY-like chemotaxis protein